VTFYHLDAIHFPAIGRKALHFISDSQDANNSGRSRVSWHIFLFSVQLIFSKLLHMSLDKYNIYMNIVALKNNYNYSIWPFHLKSFCVKLPQIIYRYIALQKLYFLNNHESIPNNKETKFSAIFSSIYYFGSFPSHYQTTESFFCLDLYIYI
jgi:hypothetical protein